MQFSRPLALMVYLLTLAAPSFAVAHGAPSDELAGSLAYISEHGISVVQSSDGGTLLVLQTDLAKDIDANLRVILGNDGMFAPETDLGPLAKISGLQVLKAPATVDVSAFDELHIWDRDTNTVIGIAQLR